jgi:hypothetical protein
MAMAMTMTMVVRRLRDQLCLAHDACGAGDWEDRNGGALSRIGYEITRQDIMESMRITKQDLLGVVRYVALVGGDLAGSA